MTLRPLFPLLFFACLAACAHHVEEKSTILVDDVVKQPKCGEERWIKKGDSGSVERKKVLAWYPNSVGVVNGGPTIDLFRDQGNVLHLRESMFVVGSLDGLASREITVQLPARLEIAQSYSLIGLPKNRKPLLGSPDYSEKFPLHCNEVFLSGFANPHSAVYDHKQLKGSAHILSVTPQKIRVRIQLKTARDGKPTSIDETHEFQRCDLQ